MNELVPRQNTNIATAMDDPFAAFAQEAGQRSIVGKLLKFSKGDWLTGEDNDDVAIGTRFVANMDELMRGWVRWEDNKPTDHVMGKVAQAYQPPRRNELGDTDKDQWEVDNNGQSRDPWQATFYLVLKGTGEDASELYTFTASSKGGRDAIGKLCEDYSKGRRKQQGEVYPVIEIGTGSYQHPNRDYGRIKTPSFTVVGWVPKDVFADAEGSPAVISDEVPPAKAKPKEVAKTRAPF